MSALGKAVGIDIGGTKIAVATAEASGEVVREMFAAPASEAIARPALAPRGRITVARGQLGNRAGNVGAASAVMNLRTKE